MININEFKDLHEQFIFETFAVGAPLPPPEKQVCVRVTHKKSGKAVSSLYSRNRNDNTNIAYFLCRLWVQYGVKFDEKDDLGFDLNPLIQYRQRDPNAIKN